jgi:Zn finger protein HypA/HybF involved in hydrogenase expression
MGKKTRIYSKVVTKKTVKRKCLKCGGEFPSTGSGNRICGQCNSHNNQTFSKDVVKPIYEWK